LFSFVHDIIDLIYFNEQYENLHEKELLVYQMTKPINNFQEKMNFAFDITIILKIPFV